MKQGYQLGCLLSLLFLSVFSAADQAVPSLSLGFSPFSPQPSAIYSPVSNYKSQESATSLSTSACVGGHVLVGTIVNLLVVAFMMRNEPQHEIHHYNGVIYMAAAGTGALMGGVSAMYEC